MFHRELPLHARAGWLIRLHEGRIAPGSEGGLLQPWQPWPEDVVLLGYWNDDPVAMIIETDPPPAAQDWPTGRQWLSRLPESQFSLLSTALQVGSWWRDHRFCGRCGSHAERIVREFAMHCPNCGHRNYPRISPCIITLVTHGKDMLLGRNRRFPPGRYSTLAGFIEAGESAEEAVRREIYEEVGITLGPIRYFKSQAWPFPHSLMLGFFAEATSRRIRIDEDEIADAAWFSPTQALPQLPPIYSISRALINAHLNAMKGEAAK
ncbi:NAD(+) diphosphatase [Pistricoccus aurantiacus]|uniref:NAD(+) diphosphatase n=1 Tax=Pistricoccus aurantiacus TaxID=1883414 RepID=A0A5B8SYY0_9GAMM|nr:NAD(+) diphosphatase [Pistricoccus aurantiacus]QEA40033.1 NAD(+) diphosphatase [Pistricoccus aurantiacus]